MAQTVIQIPDVPPSRLTRSLAELSSPAYSANLYVACYDDSLTAFKLSCSDSAISLVASPPNKDCGTDPTWLDLDRTRRKLFCLNEQIDPKTGSASIAEYDIRQDGNLTLVNKVDTPPGGPVQSKFLPIGAAGEGVHVIAHYSPGTFTALDQNLKPVSKIDLAAGEPGPTKRQQEGKSNGHGVVTHPRLKSRVLVPDLSQDKVWVIDCSLTGCTNVSSLAVPPGTGPRHAALWVSPENADSMFLYVVGEISNMIEGYEVTVRGDTLSSEHVSTTSATQTAIKDGYAAAEILISPDQKFLVVSNRANNLSNIEECDSSLKTCKLRPSDTITTFRPSADGKLENVQAWAAGGTSPRAFEFNSKGDLVAVGLDRRLVIVQRDVETGKLGQVVIDVAMGDQVTSVVWDEIPTNQADDTSQNYLGLN